MILFFDTETTGLPKNWKAPITDLNNWPRLVQLAFLLFDKDGNKISSGDYIIKPNGFTIPKESSRIHGISTEKAIVEGYDVESILNDFKELIEKASYIVAHNMSYDEKIVGAEFLRANMPNYLSKKKKICTMESSTNFCAIKGPYGYKWPKLSELHYKLFNTEFEEAHNAAVDIAATAKCFWELLNKKIINIQNVSIDQTNDIDTSIESIETKELKNQLGQYCKENNLDEIPLGAKAEAIMFLESKFKQVNKDANIESEFKFLRDFWARNDSNILSASLNKFQKDFLFSTKKIIIKEHNSFSLFSDNKNKTINDKIIQLEVLSHIKANKTEKYRNLVILLYYYYLSTYYDFLPENKRPKRTYEDEKIDYSGFPEGTQKCHESFEKLIIDFRSILAKSDKGNLSDAIIDLVKNCNKELICLKSLVGIEHKIYTDSSTKIVKLSISMLSEWIKGNSILCTSSFQGSKLVNDFFHL
ncbi:MAG: 3'-5' exonuclease, partial [Chlorobi bacterium]|nr:3'-5' exonuclease [Chlorobiota bacterium]